MNSIRIIANVLNIQVQIRTIDDMISAHSMLTMYTDRCMYVCVDIYYMKCLLYCVHVNVSKGGFNLAIRQIQNK